VNNANARRMGPIYLINFIRFLHAESPGTHAGAKSASSFVS
jgi:hypothetical protein